MIFYFDTSALVKRYIGETGSEEVNKLLSDGSILRGSVAITQVEMAAAMQKSIRIGYASADLFPETWQDFLSEWNFFTRIQISGDVIARASQIAWKYKLRGYDSLHLAAALLWHEAINEPITLATFDRELWAATKKAGLDAWPEDLIEGE